MRVPLLLTLLLAVGCTHYEYDLVRPSDLAQHIGSKEDVIAALDPLEFRFRSYEDHLVIRIFNPTDDPIHVLGGRSSVVDPKGQSHPIRDATIESHSFVKLILPPPPPYVASHPPGTDEDVGMSPEIADDNHPVYLMNGGDGHFQGVHREFIGGWGWSYYDPWYCDCYAPRYYVLYDADDTTYWDWHGETRARLALSFERNGKTYRDEFEFQRVKVK